MVIGHSVDVIEDQCHTTIPPLFPLATQLAYSFLQTLFEESMLDVTSGVGRVSNQHLSQWPGRAIQISRCSSSRVKMIRRDLPDLIDVFSEQCVVAARGPHAEATQHLAVRLRCRDRPTRLLLRVPRHRRTLVRVSDGTLRAHPRVKSKVDPGWCSRLARLALVQKAGVQVLPPELGCLGTSSRCPETQRRRVTWARPGSDHAAARSPTEGSSSASASASQASTSALADSGSLAARTSASSAGVLPTRLRCC